MVTVRFNTIAGWPGPRWLRKWLACFGPRPRFQPVGERDWFHEPRDRFVRFFTALPLVVCMPDERSVEYEHACFRRLRT